ncbi:Pyridoxal biosynthesis protein PDX1.1 [Platanthera zijinensis]|uniref:Pyridoxal biosynthesis protein PDX1.1 n=1 Tax=Platanthera zijinensis TaxID=2320716 RepID=A0AAP0BUD8_9ASPA
MLHGGVIMDVLDAAQARITEEACAVMCLECVVTDICTQGGVGTLKLCNPLLS